jgi:putative transposase
MARERDSPEGIRVFGTGGARPPTEVMAAFIDDHRGKYGVEPISAILPIATSTFYDLNRKQESPALRSERAKRGESLREEVRRVHEACKGVQGVSKVWRLLKRERVEVARCTVERLSGDLGLQGVRRGKRVKTTIGDDSHVRPVDLVQHDFTADRPNQLWVADFTYASTWLGFFFVAFVADALSRRTVDWRLSRSMTADFVLDALEPAIHAWGPGADWIHHSDQGSQPEFEGLSQHPRSRSLGLSRPAPLLEFSIPRYWGVARSEPEPRRQGHIAGPYCPRCHARFTEVRTTCGE